MWSFLLVNHDQNDNNWFFYFFPPYCKYFCNYIFLMSVIPTAQEIQEAIVSLSQQFKSTKYM